MKAVKVEWGSCYIGDSSIKPLIADILHMGGNICGGFPRYMSQSEEARQWGGMPNDIDIFPSSDKNKSDINRYLLSQGFQLHKMSVAANTFHSSRSPLDFQVINISCPSPEMIISDFDIEACKFFFASMDVIEGTEQAFDDNNKSTITISNGWESPIELAYRVGKYVSKGFTLDPLNSIRLCTLLEGELDTDIRLQEVVDKQDNILRAVHMFRTSGLFEEISRTAYANFIKRFHQRIEELRNKYKNTML